MVLKAFTLLLFAIVGFVRGGLTSEDSQSHVEYIENLELRPLPRNQLLASFLFEGYSEPELIEEFFKAESAQSPADYFEYAVFPRSLGQIVRQTNTHELHLRFSQGWWDAETWGSQPRNGSYAGGIGVEIWAWVEGKDLEQAQESWSRLVNALSGLFCASLNFIDSSHTTYPVKSFTPFAPRLSDPDANLYLLHGALPREPVCTENLTPFIKLLPCRGKAGISSLLDGHKIFDAQWQAMAIDVVSECQDHCRWHLTQVIDAVVDVPRSLRKQFSSVPIPDPQDQLRCNTSKPYNSWSYCFPLGEEKELSWKVSEVFGREIKGSCPVAGNKDHVFVSAPANAWEVGLASKDRSGVEGYNMDGTNANGVTFTLEQYKSYDVELKSNDTDKISDLITPPVLVERSFTGHGQERGGLRSVFTNPSATDSVKFVYFETLPWYMKVYLHTMKTEIRYSPAETPKIIQDIYYRPALDRKRPTQLEVEIILPPSSSAALSYDFDKSLLYISEYPPDANRGFDIPPGVLTVQSDGGAFTIRTTSLLLSLPTPDFSMPYNVIILTCTVMALTFGTIFNLVVKRVVTVSQAESLADAGRIRKIVKSILEFFRGEQESIALETSNVLQRDIKKPNQIGIIEESNNQL